MLFWAVSAAMMLIVLAMVLSPFFGPGKGQADNPSIALYKAQLAQVDHDVERGILAGEEAQHTRAEVARRLLAASKVTQTHSTGPKPWPVAAVCLVAAGAGALGLYAQLGVPGYGDMPIQLRLDEAATLRANRPTQATAEMGVRTAPVPDFPADYLANVERLRAMVPQRQTDIQGWELLAYHEARLRNFPAAAAAQDRLIALKGAEATPDDLIRHADLMVAAADGYISPEAEARVRAVLERAPHNLAARYYMGAMYDQTGRPDLAFRLWRGVLEAGAPNDVYVTLVRGQIERVAHFAGADFTLPGTAPAPMPAPAPIPVNDLPGPDAQQMQDAQQMAPEDRQAMIEGMVASLAGRLATAGGTSAEWARLITAYTVLGRTDDARTVLAEAREAFAGSPADLAILDEAAGRLPPAE